MEKGADSSPVKKAGDISISGQQQRFGPPAVLFSWAIRRIQSFPIWEKQYSDYTKRKMTCTRKRRSSSFFAANPASQMPKSVF